jgi:hypothetical protein
MTDNVLCSGDKTSGKENYLGLQGICPFRENLNKYVALLLEVRVASLFSWNTESL